MIRNWLEGRIDDGDLENLHQRAVAPQIRKCQDLQAYYDDPGRRELKYFLGLVLAPGGPGDERMGLVPRLEPPVTLREFMDDMDRCLRCQLALIDRRADLGFDDAWLPSLWPYTGGRNLEEAFGCEVRRTDGSDYPCASPAIGGPEEAESLQSDLRESPRCRRHLQAIRYFAERTGNRIPIRAGQALGPISLAAEVMPATELLVGLFTHPEQMHSLLDRLADSAAAWIRMQMAEAQDVWCGTWQYRFAAGRGVPIADDSQVMLSPTLFEEFCGPALASMGESFGGFYLHFCGGWSPTLEPLRRIAGFRGIDTQMSIEQYQRVRDVLGPEALIFAKVREGPVGSVGASIEYVRRFLKTARDSRTVVWLNAKSIEEARALEQVAGEFAA